MKSRHGTIQNRSIVNAADGTSDAIQSIMHACAASLHRAADNLTANRGRYDERQQKHQAGMVQHGDLDHFYGGLWNRRCRWF